MDAETSNKMAAGRSSVETPSGKGSDAENFPVGSILIARRLRPHVATFYAFARAADDIADNPALEPEDKLRRLAAFATTLKGETPPDGKVAKAERLRRSLAETNVPIQHGLDLLEAFSRDAVKPRTADWADLMSYCEVSANPVGRYLLDLHGEDRAGWPASDALCSALQVLNHLQDCAKDYRQLDRVYLPADWLAAEGASLDDLTKAEATPGLRRVLDRCLEATDALLRRADQLAPNLKDTRLALESASITRLAWKLSARLWRQDPIAQRVELSRPALAGQAVAGAARELLRRSLPGSHRPAPAGESRRAP
ncbi:squalene synthase HpnC [Algihabitans albus]|uniref:squalene synthase HpnC n=1 Tax=Algihabitans albus TaxID=2164067 RepID=UPI001F239670|nr:squalene synthase HpnC [Algihabitans albus]